jgi:hypothetical protein
MSEDWSSKPSLVVGRNGDNFLHRLIPNLPATLVYCLFQSVGKSHYLIQQLFEIAIACFFLKKKWDICVNYDRTVTPEAILFGAS